MKKLLLGAVALLTAMGVAMPQSAMAVRSDSRTYVAAGGDANVIDLSTRVPGGPGIGGAIFDFVGTETSVKITVADLVAKGNIAFYWQYTDNNPDPAANSLGYGDVCGPTVTLPKVAGATGVAIFIDQTWQALACSVTKQQPGTTGTIRADFT